MPKIPSDEQLAFHYAVYLKVCEISKGHVTSYGQIAKLIYCPQRPRQVGMSLKHMSYYTQFLRNPTTDHELIQISSIPWWRVINSAGGISKRSTNREELEQVTKLRDEGIEVEKIEWTRRSNPPSSWTPYHIDLDRYGWFPEVSDDDNDDDDDTVSE